VKPIYKQLIIGAFVLALVIVASLGIRQVRFSIHRARAVDNSEIIETEPNTIPAESETLDHELDPQYADLPESEEQEPPDDYAESGKNSKAFSKSKLSKADYAKAKGWDSGGLEKVSIGDNENFYRTAEGEYWYVGEGPDGKSFKMQMQVQVDEATGEMTIVGKVYSNKAGSSASPRKISIGEGDNVYITEKGQTWYVTDDYKAQVEIDDTTGEITVIEQHGDVDGK
jgi:hypothetical protein